MENKNESNVKPNWEEAENHLKDCKGVYISIGYSGVFVLNLLILPLESRFLSGERSEDLYNSIMDISL